MSNALAVFENSFIQNETQFTDINDYNLNFKKEIGFAIQALRKSKPLLDAAKKNPVAMQNAIVNIAAIGLTLNPAEKLAYLIPRGGEVCLDIPYMGLVKILTDCGSIKFVQAKVIRQNDEFEYVSVDEQPIHTFNAKLRDKERGDIASVYCVAKTSDGDYLTEIMNMDAIEKARSKSQSFKYGNGPWITDFEEMAKKSVVRKASKLLPKSERLSLATSLLDNVDGYDNHGNEMCSLEKADNIMELCLKIDNGVERLTRYVKSAFGKEKLSLVDLTDVQATSCEKAMLKVYNSEAIETETVESEQ